LIVSDPANPANEGKVMLYQFGKKIYDKIIDAMQPEFADEKPVDPFNFWEGADFKLKIRQVEGYRNYDKSEFDSATELFGGDEAQLEEVYNKLYKLSEFTDAESYKEYSELKKKLYEVIGEADVANTFTTAQNIELNTTKEPVTSNSVESSMDEVGPTASSGSDASVTSDDSEDTLSYFAKLAQS
jgi:hypothetical protein